MTDADILDALELGSLALPWLPGKAEQLHVPGLLARTTEISSPFVNLVSMVRRTESDVDEAIATVNSHFRAKNVEFGWITGPRTRPMDVAARLQRDGLSLLTGYSGLVSVDLAAPIASPDDVEVQEVGIESIDDVDRIKAASFGWPLAAAHWIDELLLKGIGNRVRMYLARRKGEAAWGAFGQCWHAPHAPIVILGGGGVSPEARGQGLFRALVKRRVDDAREAGMKAATMQSMDKTSAPIMRRLGFNEYCHMDMWTSAKAAEGS